jgi:hypothetical protein
MTRPQTERHPDGGRGLEKYLQIGKRQLSAEPLKQAVVMHPLPRRDELSEDLDSDPRSIYFKQAARGVPIRMAILAYLTGAISLKAEQPVRELQSHSVSLGQNPCPNATCISRTEARHVMPRYRLASRHPLRSHCGYCSHELQFQLVGSSDTRELFPRESIELRKLRPESLVFFSTAAEALALGFSPAAAIAPTA